MRYEFFSISNAKFMGEILSVVDYQGGVRRNSLLSIIFVFVDKSSDATCQTELVDDFMFAILTSVSKT